MGYPVATWRIEVLVTYIQRELFMVTNRGQIVRIAAALSIVISAVGCSENGLHLGNTETGALAGSALGAGLGAIVGRQTGHTGGGIAIGAAAGGLGGGLIGAQGDRQSERSRSQDERLRRQEEELARQRREIEELRRGGANSNDSYRPYSPPQDDYRYDDGARHPSYETPRDTYQDRY
jgi:hypothetical protein